MLAGRCKEPRDTLRAKYDWLHVESSSYTKLAMSRRPTELVQYLFSL